MPTFVIVTIIGTVAAILFLWLFSGLSTAGKCSPKEAHKLIRDQYRKYDENYQPVPDISEPVYAIAKAMQERPGSFRIEWLNEEAQCIGTVPAMKFDEYRITDRKTGLVATVVDHHCGSRHCRIRLPFTLTHDEKIFLWEQGEQWIHERRARAVDYRNAKRRKEWAGKYGVAS